MKSSWQNIQSPFRQIFKKQKYAESKCMELWTVLTACYVDNTLTTWTIHWLHWHYIDYVDTTLTTWTIHRLHWHYIDTTLSTLTLHWVHWHYIDYINIVLATLTLHLLHWHYIELPISESAATALRFPPALQFQSTHLSPSCIFYTVLHISHILIALHFA